jgi:hypothetical protein
MIALNEPNAYAREVAFNLPLESDPLTGLTGWSFTLGEVQVRLPGGGWIDAQLSQIVEKGYGRFCVQLTLAQVATAGDVFIRTDVADVQNYFGSDVIGQLSGDISVDSEVGSVSFYLPLATDPIFGAPLTGHTFTLGEVRVCLPDDVYVDVDVDQIEEMGYGGYRLVLTAAQTAKRGKVFVYAEVADYQRWEGYCTILDATVFGEDDEDDEDTVTPVPVPIVYGDPEYVNQFALALNRLPQQYRSGTLDYSGGLTLDGAVGSSAEDIIGEFVPVEIEYEVVIPTVADDGVSNHLASAFNRLPQQFRSGTLVYTLPITATVEDIVGVYAPPVIEYDVVIPVVTDPDTVAHLVSALGRLPQQFRSGDLYYGGATLDAILDGP